MDGEPLLTLCEIPSVSIAAIPTDDDYWFSALSGAATSRMGSATTVRLANYSYREPSHVITGECYGVTSVSAVEVGSFLNHAQSVYIPLAESDSYRFRLVCTMLVYTSTRS